MLIAFSLCMFSLVVSIFHLKFRLDLKLIFIFSFFFCYHSCWTMFFTLRHFQVSTRYQAIQVPTRKFQVFIFQFVIHHHFIYSFLCPVNCFCNFINVILFVQLFNFILREYINILTESCEFYVRSLDMLKSTYKDNHSSQLVARQSYVFEIFVFYYYIVFFCCENIGILRWQRLVWLKTNSQIND